MPSYVAQIRNNVKKQPGFFTPFSSKTEPLKVAGGAVLCVPVGALLAVFGLIGTAGCGVNTVVNVTTCGDIETPAKKTAACFSLAIMGLFIAAAAPIYAPVSLITRTGATIAHKITSKETHHSTTPQDAAVVEVKVPVSDAKESSNHQEFHEEENHVRITIS